MNSSFIDKKYLIDFILWGGEDIFNKVTNIQLTVARVQLALAPYFYFVGKFYWRKKFILFHRGY
jgi:hypothetical protein